MLRLALGLVFIYLVWRFITTLKKPVKLAEKETELQNILQEEAIVDVEEAIAAKRKAIDSRREHLHNNEGEQK